VGNKGGRSFVADTVGCMKHFLYDYGFLFSVGWCLHFQADLL
jgi:hypothetical protein